MKMKFYLLFILDFIFTFIYAVQSKRNNQNQNTPTLDTYTTNNCFTETYYSYLKNLRENIDYYEKLCNIKNYPEIVEVLNYNLYVEDFLSRLYYNSTLVSQEVINLIRTSIENFPIIHKDFITKETNNFLTLFLENFEKIQKEKSWKLDKLINLKTIKVLVKIKKYFKHQFNINNLPVHLKNNLYKVWIYRKYIIHITNTLLNSYALATDCLPTDFNYYPIYARTYNNFKPKDNSMTIFLTDEIWIDPKVIDLGGVALSFIIVENYNLIQNSKFDKIEILNGFKNNIEVLSYKINSNSNNLSVNHEFSFTNSTIKFETNSKCQQKIFVLISLEKECLYYKMSFSVRLPQDNKYIYYNKKVSADAVEDLVLSFNEMRYPTHQKKRIVKKIRAHKNFNYLPNEDLKILFDFEDNYYFDNIFYSNGFAKKCIQVENCIYSSIENSNCIICAAGFVNFNGACLVSCPDGFFANDKKECVECDWSCETCEISNDNCTKCKKDKYDKVMSLYKGICVDVCPANTYSTPNLKNIPECIECDSNCIRCSDNKCVFCKFGFYSLEGKCVENCSKDYYQDSNLRKCIKCNSKCDKCTANDECTSCKDTFFLIKGKCVTKCGNGYFTSVLNNKCLACPQNCQKCDSDNQSCDLCNVGFDIVKLEGGNPLSVCKNKCPDYNIMKNDVCVKCLSSNCLECDSKNLSSCNKCEKGFVLKDNTCVKDCGIGHFLNEFTLICEKCSHGCDSCKNTHNCSICSGDSLFLNDGNGVISCVKSCPDNYTKSNRMCVNCQNSQCKKCQEDLKLCTECYKGRFNNKGVCIEKCPEKTVEFNGRCENCPNGCKDCDNPITCNQCENNYFLKNSECVEGCGLNFIHNYGNKCIRCNDVSCDICDESNSSKCLKCSKSTFKYNNKCLPACPANTFADKENVCQPCGQMCDICKNPRECLKCSEGKFLLPDNSCDESCGEGYSTLSQKSKSCEKCVVPYCKKCEKSLNSCEDCQLPFKKLFSDCVLQCPNGFYFDSLFNECRKCNPTCEKCNLTANDCLECKKGFDDKGRCQDKCPDQFVVDIFKQKNCKECNKNCLKCDPYNLNNCLISYDFKFDITNLKCKLKFILKRNIFAHSKCLVKNCHECKENESDICIKCSEPFHLMDGTCFSQCPQGFYFELLESNKECKRCHVENCEVCDDTSFNCHKCKYGFFQLNNECILSCPENYQSDYESRVCRSCNVNNCVNCQNNIKSCQQCSKDLFFNEKENKCVLDCPMQTFANEYKKKCETCSENCLVCSSPIECQKCNYQTILFEGHCISECNIPNYYLDNFECKRCKDENCLNCVEGEACMKCKQDLFIKNEKCVPDCGHGYVLKEYNECEKCPSNCKKCSLDGKCLECFPSHKLLNDLCEDSCPKGSINIDSKCHPCNVEPNCIKCSIGDFEKCTECEIGYFLLDGKCVTTCPNNFYNQDNRCKPCDINCSKCIDKNKCQICNQNYFLLNNSCSFSCPKGYYSDKGKCLKCKENCEECTDESNCILCARNLKISGGECKSECEISSYFDHFLNKCHSCEKGCDLCDSKDQCLVCSQQLKLSNGKCIETCEEGYIYFNQKCKKCPYGCEKCKSDEVGNIECIKCNSNKSLLKGSCISDCPVGFYTNSLNECKRCSVNCDECVDENKCLKCKAGSAISPFNSECLDECPIFHFNNEGVCQKCRDANCISCDEDKCLDCLKPFKLLNSTCVSECGENYYTDYSANKCLSCDYNCKKCNDKSQCDECKYGYIKQFNKNDKKFKCVSSCGEGKTNINEKCYNCKDENCQQCSIGDIKTCEKCNNHSILFNNSTSNSCLQTCPKFYYADYDEKICKNCSTNCKYCQNDHICKKCIDGFVVHKGKCIESCPDHFTERNSKCIPCLDKNCLECNNINNNKCLLCDTKYYLKNDQCLNSCEEGNFVQKIGNKKICISCPDNCIICEDETTCKVCNKNFILNSNGRCEKHCQDNTVENDGKCINCLDAKCKICDANSPEKCKQCIKPFVLSDNICLSNCPNGQTISNDSTCIKCKTEFCKVCSLPNTCDECIKGKILHENKCLDECPFGFTNQKGKCIPCEVSNCSSCANSKCDKCMSNFYLHDQKCLNECPEGTYKDKYKCIPCNIKGCRSCSSAENCDKCDGQLILQVSKNKTKVCSDFCGEKFANVSLANNTFECRECNNTSDNCLKCDSNDITKCIECGNNTLLNRFNNTCEQNCPNGTYKSNNECLKCDENCEICKNFKICTKCVFPYVLMNGKCIRNCDSGFLNVKGKCEKCSTENCDKCDLTACLKCQGNQVLFNNTCVDNCPLNTFLSISNKTCSDCPENCTTCRFSNTDKKVICLECDKGFYKLDGKCVKYCPESYFKNLTLCSKCSDMNCLQCGLNGECTKCNNSTFLYNETCYSHCPEKTFSNLTKNVCNDCSLNCLKCNSYDICEKCSTSFVVSSNGKCTSNCPEGFTNREDKCIPCKDTNCSLCDSSNINQCLECKKNYTLLDGKCLDKCPPGYFLLNNSCNKCKKNCDECSDKDTCNKCESGYYHYNRLECILCNQKGYVKVNDTCVECKIPNCDKCLDSTKCEVCNSQSYLDGTVCKTNCDSGYFNNESTRKCTKCHENCLTCVSEENCLTCNQTKVNHNYKCLDNCPDGYSKNNRNNCVKCDDENCKICDFNKPNICLYCKYNDMILKNGECIKECPLGSVRLNSTCIECPKDCDECEYNQLNNTFKCTKCVRNKFLKDNFCVEDCKEGYFVNLDKCKKCQMDNCLECNEKQCFRCNNTTFLYNNSCYTNCPNSTYSFNNECKDCPNNCKNCTDFINCHKCKDGYKLLVSLYNFDSPCIKECPKGLSTVNDTCVTCDQNVCLNCHLTDPSICIECDPKSISNLNYKGKCYAMCPEGTYLNSSKTECANCEAKCSKCTDMNNCINCKDGYQLANNGTCINSCPDNHVLIDSKCVRCSDKFCSQCLTDIKNCIKCQNGYLLSNGSCTDKCPEGSFLFNNQTCETCSKNCKSCKDKSKCNECIDEFLLSNFKCESICPNGSFDGGDKTCHKCLNQCEVCNNLTCLLCAEGFLKLNETCIPEANCKDGYYSDKISRNCLKCDIKNCQECDSKDKCSMCKVGYASQDGKCELIRADTSFIKSPVIFSEKSHELDNTYNVLNLFTNSSLSLDYFTMSFWFRLITSDNKGDIFNINNKMDETLVGFSIQNNQCDIIIKNSTTLYSNSCSFLQINKWNLLIVSLLKEKSITSDSYFTQNQNLLSYNPYKKIQNKYNLNKSFNSTELLNGIIRINPSYKSSPIFELANMKTFNYMLNSTEVDNILYDSSVFQCDYKCDVCLNGKCLRCLNGFLEESGYCPAAFVSLTSGLLKFDDVLLPFYSNSLNKHITKYLSSDRYTFSTFFYVYSNKTTIHKESHNIFQINYENKDNIIEMTVLDEKVRIMVGNITAKFDYTVQPNFWYAASISVTDSRIFIYLVKMYEINPNTIKYEQVVLNEEFTLRLTPEAKYTLGSKNENVSNVVYYDTRLYINNIITPNDFDFYVSTFRQEENCIRLDFNFICIECKEDYIMNKLNMCVSKQPSTPSKIFPRKSQYNNREHILSSDSHFANEKFTMHFWLRKNLPAYVESGDSLENSLISLHDSVSDKKIPILSQISYKNLTSTYYINHDNFNEMHRLSSNYSDSLKAFTVDYYNSTPTWMSFVIKSKINKNERVLTVKLLDLKTNATLTDKIIIPLQTKLSDSFIIGDKDNKGINMEYGPNSLFINDTLSNAEVQSLINFPPIDCDPSCLDCEYFKGYCRLCGMDKQQGNKCSKFFYGLTTSSVYDSEEYKKGIEMSNSDNYNPEYNVELNRLFKRNIDSETYSVIGWFQLFSLQNKTGESLLFRLSNYDNVNKNSTNSSYYPGMNLITLKVIYNQTQSIKAKYAFTISQIDKDITIPLEDIKVRSREWLLLNAYVDTKKRLFGYNIYSQLDNALYQGNYTLYSIPQKIQEITTLKFFGINSNKNNETALDTYGIFYYFYINTNIGYDIKAVKDYRNYIDPTLLKTNNTCQNNCKECLLDKCIKCEIGFIRKNNICAPEENNNFEYLLLTDQNMLRQDNQNLNIPKEVTKEDFGFQFNFRRNYLALKNNKKEFMQFGWLSLSMLEDPKTTEAYILVNSTKFINNTNLLLGPLDANTTTNFYWYTVIFNFEVNGNKTRLHALIYNINEPVDYKSVNYTNHEPFESVSFNYLNSEISIYGAIIIKTSKLLKPYLPLPEVDCPIDCSYCSKNKVCLICTYGFECDINETSRKFCKKNFNKFPNLIISNSNENSNALVSSNSMQFIKSTYLTKFIRLRNFALLFSISIKKDWNYNNIFQLINEFSSTYTISFDYNSIKKTFSLSYFTRDLHKKTKLTKTVEIYPYPSIINESTWHYIGISYDSITRKYLICMFNSNLNFLTQEIQIEANMDYFGTYTNLIFFNDLFKLNPGKQINTQIKNLKILYQQSLTTTELYNKLSTMYKQDLPTNCIKFDFDISQACQKCSGNYTMLEGQCLSENIKNRQKFLNSIGSVITSYTSTDSDPIFYRNITNSTIDSFTFQFIYKKFSNPEDLISPILSLNLFDENDKIVNSIYELYEVKSYMVGDFKHPSQENVNKTADINTRINKYYDNYARFTWLFVTIRVDLINKSNTIYIYNYYNSNTYSKTWYNPNMADTPITIPKDYKLGIKFELDNPLSITKEELSNPYITNLVPGKDTEFKISNIIFIPNYLYTDSELISLRPNPPFKCQCACQCDHLGICPSNCRVENTMLSLNKENYFNSLSGQLNQNNNIKVDSYFDFFTFSISFNIDIKAYIKKSKPFKRNDSLFILSNQYKEIESLKMPEITDNIIYYSIMSIVLFNNSRIRVFLGSNRESDYISYFDFELDLRDADKLTILMNNNLWDNYAKIIMFADNKRYEKEFSNMFAVENINMKTLYYVNPDVNDPIINFSDDVIKHLNYLNPQIATEKIFKYNICPENCKFCINSKICLECAFKYKMHNNYCIISSNINENTKKDFSLKVNNRKYKK